MISFAEACEIASLRRNLAVEQLLELRDLREQRDQLRRLVERAVPTENA